jgi:uncharacterized protein with FMN-binding domain
MRRITIWLFSTLSAVVLLFSYRTSTGAGAAPAGAAVAAAPRGESFTGTPAHTRRGDVQVRITVAGGRITAVTVPVHPDTNDKDRAINAAALPTLIERTLRAQSARVQAVTGATVTSDGYRTSLQSALDAAGR